MADALAHWLGDDRKLALRGIVVSVDEPASKLKGVDYLVGDHPLPGERSRAASNRIGELVSEVALEDQVYALISGGTTSLIGSPVDGVADEDYRREFERLLGSGADIHAMNAVRKRISRWGDGRLALAMRQASVQPIIISDVTSDNPAIIGSGPCTFDGALRSRLTEVRNDESRMRALPSAVKETLTSPATGSIDEALFDHVAPALIASHDAPVLAVMRATCELGAEVLRAERLVGEAKERGRAFAEELRDLAPVRRPVIVVAGGETTVTLTDRPGRGGRCQEFALAAAEVFAQADSLDATLLVAGTDGRDGPTDAAGALVDSATWKSVLAAGRDPAKDLLAHDSYSALDAADALIRTGPTGTNMVDVAIAVIRPRR